MTTVADYIAVQDSSTTLVLFGKPPPTIPDVPDAHGFATFDAPSLHSSSRPVLTFRVNPQLPNGGSITVTFLLNGEIVSDQLFNTDINRSWQEIFDAGILQEEDNVLVVNASAADDDDRDKGCEVVISDVVIFYKRDI